MSSGLPFGDCQTLVPLRVATAMAVEVTSSSFSHVASRDTHVDPTSRHAVNPT